MYLKKISSTNERVRLSIVDSYYDIEAHFLICFVSLVIARIVELKA